jgi:hypothetical protein
MNRKYILSSTLVVLATAGLATSSLADHSWGPYHWARTTSSFDLTIINSTTNEWDGFVSDAVSDWSASGNLNMIEDMYGDTSKKTRRRCKGGTGTVRICNLAYGNTGWLGIAGISIDSTNHITTGYTKLNDTYFADPFYDSTWQQSVTCQELGHNVGLGHQDEDFNNDSLFTCMDYQNPPYPVSNLHDWLLLDEIYGHLDVYETYTRGDSGACGDSGGVGVGGGGGCNPKSPKCDGASGPNGAEGWGASLGRRGNAETFIRIDADGTMHLTHVTWAIGY